MLGADVADRVRPAQQFGQAFVRSDQSFLRGGQHRGAQQRQHLVDPVGHAHQRRVQRLQRADHRLLDQHLRVGPQKLVAWYVLPPQRHEALHQPRLHRR